MWRNKFQRGFWDKDLKQGKRKKKQYHPQMLVCENQNFEIHSQKYSHKMNKLYFSYIALTEINFFRSWSCLQF